jgi:hypothetical protein
MAGDSAKAGRGVTKGAKAADAAISASRVGRGAAKGAKGADFALSASKVGRGATRSARGADLAVSAYKGLDAASTAWTVADLATRGLNIGSTGKLSAGEQGLSLAPALSLLGGGAGQLGQAAAPTGRLLDLLG